MLHLIHWLLITHICLVSLKVFRSKGKEKKKFDGHIDKATPIHVLIILAISCTFLFGARESLTPLLGIVWTINNHDLALILTCLCCCSCISCIAALSFSNSTGKMRMVKDETRIHTALLLKLNKTFEPLHVTCVAFEETFLKLSGNISVNPHNLSAIVSSAKSCKQNKHDCLIHCFKKIDKTKLIFLPYKNCLRTK